MSAGTEIIAYAFLVSSGVTAGYVLLIVLEVNHGNRVASDIRVRLDEKIMSMVDFLKKYLAVADRIYEKGSDAVESDLIDPIAAPIGETRKKYQTIKTGEMKIRKTPASKISPYLRRLLKKRKKI